MAGRFEARLAAVAAGTMTTTEAMAEYQARGGTRADWQGYSLEYGTSAAQVQAYVDVLAAWPEEPARVRYEYSAELHARQTGRDPLDEGE